MGQQQLLLIILGICVVGVAIAVGITAFSSENVKSNRDSLVNQLNNIGADAFSYYMKAKIMLGGGGDFRGYSVPSSLSNSQDGIYSIISKSKDTIRFRADSKSGFGSIEVMATNRGFVDTSFHFTGEFQNY